MPRVIWKGAISFGLVHVPVALYPASQETGVDFDWLDKRSMDPVGYKRINKRTGKEIEGDDIVKGIKQPGGDYVLLSEDEIHAAYPVSTQTIEIETFVKAGEVPFIYLEKPYYLGPIAKGEKVYALLREALLAAGVIGIARVVMHAKEHLAALIPDGNALMLNTIRWADEIRPRDEIDFPAAGPRGASLKETELKMAVQLVEDMTGPWKPADYSDKFTAAIHALAKHRVEAGQSEQVTPLEEAAADAPGTNVLDLTELLKQSLKKRGPAHAAGRDPADQRAAPVKAARKAATKAAHKGTGKAAARKAA